MVSIIMSTYNKAKYLDLTLAAYTIQSYKNFELVIIDDGSTDNTSDIVKKYSTLLDIKYHKEKFNSGAATARNKALKLASYNYVIIVDDDRIPHQDFVLEHKKFLDKNPQTVSVGKQGLILSIFSQGLKLKFNDEFLLYNKYPELLNIKYSQLFTPKDIINNFNNILAKYYLSDYNDESLSIIVNNPMHKNFNMLWTKAYGGNMAFDKTYCKKELKYDVNYKGYGCEDIDFSYQLYLQDFKFAFNNTAINYHQEHKRKENESKESYKNFIYFYNKYHTLEILLMKMDFEGIISLEEANSILNLLENPDYNVQCAIREYIDRKMTKVIYS